MPTESNRDPSDEDVSGTRHEDAPMAEPSEDRVLEETARMAREGRQQLEADPKEPKPASD